MNAIQSKTIEKDFPELLREFGECDELNFAVLADCICQHLNELQKMEKRHRQGLRDMAGTLRLLQCKLIESIPEDLIMFSSEDKDLTII